MVSASTYAITIIFWAVLAFSLLYIHTHHIYVKHHASKQEWSKFPNMIKNTAESSLSAPSFTSASTDVVSSRDIPATSAKLHKRSGTESTGDNAIIASDTVGANIKVIQSDLGRTNTSELPVDAPIKVLPLTVEAPILTNVNQIKPMHRTLESYRVSSQSGIAWKEFVQESVEPPRIVDHLELPPGVELKQCSQDTINKLAAPGLSDNDFKWCKWALSPAGGQVKIGKSYGQLDGPSRNRYEQLNCNTVASGTNPSCNDVWGDAALAKWKRNRAVPNVCTGVGNDSESSSSSSRSTGSSSSPYTSQVFCSDSSSNARFCLFENVMLDFNKMHLQRRSRATHSRKWDPGFLATDCNRKMQDINYFKVSLL